MLRHKILGVSGKAGSGKDTLAAVLVNSHRYYRRALADDLKEQAFEHLTGDNPGWYGAYLTAKAQGQCETGLEFINLMKQHDEMRQYLQAYGEAHRFLFSNYWLRRLEQHLRPLDGSTSPLAGFVVPDVRYPNEVEYIKSLGGKVVRVERPDYDNGLSEQAKAHPSETALDDWDWDGNIFVNRGTLDEFVQQISLFARMGAF